MSQALMTRSTKDPVPKLPATLPSIYRPLAPLLQQLSGELLQVLNGPLSSLASLNNPFAGLEFEDQGDFAGLSGMDTRGDLQRLANSEWLLQAEVPDEFLRRLLEQEVLYQQPLFENPGKLQIARLVLDAGPHSLGLPRLLQVAVLLHLSALAQRAQIDLVWAIAGEQHPAQTGSQDASAWRRDLDHRALRKLLRTSVLLPTTHQTLTDLLDDEHKRRGLAADDEDQAEPPIDFLLAPQAAVPPHHQQTNLLLFAPLARDDEGHPQLRLVQQLAGQTQEVRQVSLPSDDLCLAALRRPLAPAVGLSQLLAQRADPAAWPKVERTWVPRHFDFAARAFAVARYKHYFLVLGRKSEHSFAVLLPDDANFFGYRLGKKSLSLWLRGIGDRADHMEMQIHSLKRGLPTGRYSSHYAPITAKQFAQSFGPFDLPILPFADKTHVTFHDAERQRFIAHFDGRSVQPSQDSRSLVVLGALGDRALYTGARGLRLASLAESRANAWPSTKDHDGFDPDPSGAHSFLFNPTQQLLSLTNDGVHWHCFYQHVPVPGSHILQEDHRALCFFVDRRRFKALIYADPALGGDGRLQQFTFATQELEDYNQHDIDARLTQLRFDHRSQEVWATRLGDDGQVEGVSLLASHPKADNAETYDYDFSKIVERSFGGKT